MSGEFWLGVLAGGLAVAVTAATLFVWWLTGLVRK